MHSRHLFYGGFPNASSHLIVSADQQNDNQRSIIYLKIILHVIVQTRVNVLPLISK